VNLYCPTGLEGDLAGLKIRNIDGKLVAIQDGGIPNSIENSFVTSFSQKYSNNSENIRQSWQQERQLDIQHGEQIDLQQGQQNRRVAVANVEQNVRRNEERGVRR
jgi:hypothetical protein